MLNKYKKYFIIISIILIILLIIISGLYYLNSIYYESNDLIEERTVSVEFGDIYEDNIDVTFAAINEDDVNNIILMYNENVIKENINAGDIITINDIECDNTIYIIDKENDMMNTLEEFDIPCENSNRY